MLPATRTISTVSGLRTRYFPRSRIGQGLITVAPWLDVVLLLVCFVLVDARFTIQPGIVLELPDAPFTGGLHSDFVAVVFSIERIGDQGREEIVFFDDARFRVDSDEQMQKLEYAFATLQRTHPGMVLIVQADRHVMHGTLVEIFDMARNVGIRKVNLATAPEPGAVPLP
jgi:biopolymer transport protein ExbD